MSDIEKGITNQEMAMFYGREFYKYCSCGAKHDSGKASDICFGDFYTDVAAIWCPACGIKIAFNY